MNIHEYQAKGLLRKAGAPVSEGAVVLRAEEAKTAASALDGPVWVVKAQIHAGGRGKGTFKETDAGDKGGVRVTKSVEEAAEETRRMLGRTLVTKQTGETGKQVNRIYIEDGAGIDREMYLALLVDRGTSRVSFVASTEGGMDIEEVAEETPDKILSFSVDPATGYQPYHGRRIAFALELQGAQIKQCVKLMGQLYNLFIEKDMEMLEINPLITTSDGDLKCLDAKMGFDGNALYRHPDVMELRDETEEDPKELEASKYDLNYIALDGEIGCMVNGAGLAMATMDIIKLYGAEPANFLDVGGGATKEKVTEAFKIITSDPNVKGILVNIFGGIMRCDVIAEGVVAAVKEVGLQVPLVVRLEGTNVEEGKAIINNSDVDVIAADDLKDGAEKIVKAVKGWKFMRLLTSKPATIAFACLALALMTLSVAARSPESDARAGITAFSSHCFSPLLTAAKAADVFGFANVRHDFYDLDPFSNAAPSLATARAATPGTDRRCEVSFYGDFAADAVSAVTERLRQEGIITPADLPAPHEELRTDGTALLAARRLNPNKIAVVHVGTRPHDNSIETFLNVERLRSPQ